MSGMGGTGDPVLRHQATADVKGSHGRDSWTGMPCQPVAPVCFKGLGTARSSCSAWRTPQADSLFLSCGAGDCSVDINH